MYNINGYPNLFVSDDPSSLAKSVANSMNKMNRASIKDMLDDLISDLKGDKSLDRSVLLLLEKALSIDTGPEDSDMKYIFHLMGLIKSKMLVNDLTNGNVDIKASLQTMLDKYKPGSSNLNKVDGLRDFLEQYIYSKNSKADTEYVIGSIHAFWYSEMTKAKHELQDIYANNDNLQDPLVDVNSPDTLVKLNNIMGRMEMVHNFFTSSIAKMFGALSNIANRM